MDLLGNLKRARAVGTPLIAITTADQPALLATLAGNLNGKSPLLSWDVIRGYQALNEPGREAKAAIVRDQDEVALTNFVPALIAANDAPDRTVIIVQQAQRLLDDAPVIQGLMNLREAFKSSQRTIILIGPSFRFPPELAQDILTLNEPLPNRETIQSVLTRFWGENGVEYAPELLEASTDALAGLASFPVEQAAALSLDLKTRTVDVPSLWERKRSMLPPGLTLELPKLTFSDVGGLNAWKEYAALVFAGKRRPRALIFIDEIDKLLNTATSGDNTGVSQDFHQMFLTELEDRDYQAGMFFGVGGGGKSYIVRATGAQYGCPVFRFDVGAVKGPHVGESEQAIRSVWKAIYAIAGQGGAMVLATCNRQDVLSPELKRRFERGIGFWYFDLPDMDERHAVGRVQCQHYGINESPDFFRKCEGWSSANIRNCVERADSFGCTLAEASRYIVAAVTQDPDGLNRLRNTAQGKWLSASYPGTYRIPEASQTKPARGRRIVED